LLMDGLLSVNLNEKKNPRKNKIRYSFSDKVFIVIVCVFLVTFTFCVLYPLIYVVSCSFSSAESLVRGQVFIVPVNPSLEGYRAVFNNEQVWTGYYNSAVYTISGTLISVLVTFTGAYVLSRKEFPMRGIITGLYVITMFFSGGLLPFYLLIRQLKMINTIWAIILPGAFNVWLAIIARTFIQSTIPEELFEATALDGGDYFQYFMKVVFPLSKPILAVLALNFAVGFWNSYFNALIFLNDSKKFPLQIILRNILISKQVDYESLSATDARSLLERQYLSELLKYSLIIVASVPLLVVYPFIQKYFIKGVMID